MADMDKDDLTEEAMAGFLARWLPPTEAPEELAQYLAWGVACWIELDYGAGLCIDAGRAYKTADGYLVFATVEGGWCTPYVKSWLPELNRGVDRVKAPVEDAE